MAETSLPAHEAQLNFSWVMAVYQEFVTSSGNLQAVSYEQMASKAKVTNSGSSQTIQPSQSDLICDVELSAARILNSGELAYFKLFYKSGAVVVPSREDNETTDECFEEHVATFPESRQEAIRRIDHRIRVKLGNHFKDIGLSPPRLYMKSVDCRNKIVKEPHWFSHLY